MTSIRDRTQEFLKIVDRLQSRQGKKTNDAEDATGPANAMNQFNSQIQTFNDVLQQCRRHLVKLNDLTKTRSVFDDLDAQFNEVTGIMKHDVGSAQQLLKSMQQRYLTQRSVHHERILQSQASKLAEITQEFQKVLQQKQTKLKAVNERRSKFFGASQIPEESLMPAFQESQLRQRHHIVEKDEWNQSHQQQEQVEEEPVYSQARNTLSAVESSISQLGAMFQQLAGMVQQQHELAARIDQDIEGAYENVDAGQKQLLKYMKFIKSNRGLIIKIFIAIILVSVVYILLI